MIIGLGTDIVDNRRINDTLKKFGNKFKKRCFSDSEIKRSEKKFDEVNSFSKRYAAKEACAKALGTGLARGVFWKDIEVVNDKYGKPKIKLYNKALKILNKYSTYNVKIEVSLSDEKNYSIANVIIFKDEN
tara:strand:- start:37 stop:429 length:393 start_codon:yes stop_codon:yes gene_type:complete